MTCTISLLKEIIYGLSCQHPLVFQLSTGHPPFSSLFKYRNYFLISNGILQNVYNSINKLLNFIYWVVSYTIIQLPQKLYLILFKRFPIFLLKFLLHHLFDKVHSNSPSFQLLSFYFLIGSIPTLSTFYSNRMSSCIMSPYVVWVVSFLLFTDIGNIQFHLRVSR